MQRTVHWRRPRFSWFLTPTSPLCPKVSKILVEDVPNLSTRCSTSFCVRFGFIKKMFCSVSSLRKRSYNVLIINLDNNCLIYYRLRLSLDNLKSWGTGNGKLFFPIPRGNERTFNDNLHVFSNLFTVFVQYFVLFFVVKIKFYKKLFFFGPLTSSI